MKPLLIFFLGAGALWAIQRGRRDLQGQGIVLPQNQRGISRFRATPTPQEPQMYYAGMQSPPDISSPPGYVPAFGPNFSQLQNNPDVLYWNQA